MPTARARSRVGWGILLYLGEQPLLQWQIFKRSLDDEVSFANGIGQVRARHNVLHCTLGLPEVPQIGPDAFLQGSEACLARVIHRDVMAMAGKDLGNPMPHQSSADHANAQLVGHVHSAGGVTAVGVEDVTGIKVGSGGGEKQQWASEIGRLAEAPLWHAR